MRRNRTQMMDPIRRGTTPTLTLKYPYDPEIIEDVEISFEQRCKVVFKKSLDGGDVTMDPGRIFVDLTREETLQLTTVDLCRIQMLFFLKHGKTAASGIYKVPVLEIL